MARRRPSGTYVRDTADYFVHRCASGDGDVPLLAGNYAYVILFNDNPNGQKLYVYTAWAYTRSTDPPVLEVVGPFSGTKIMQGVNIDPGEAWPGGTIYSAYSPTPLGTRVGSIGSANSGITWPTSTPMAIVRPGNGFAVRSLNLGQEAQASFWWYVL